MRVRSPVRPLSTAALLTLALAFPAALAPLRTQAQPLAAATSPVIDGVEINADSGLSPGSTLDIAVRGTPRGQARVQLVGSGVAVPLRESAPGLYTGRYTVASGDRIDASRPIQATLRANGRMVISEFDFPTSFQAARNPAPATARAPVSAAVPAPRIETFGADPVATLEPGAELRFVIDGTPGAAASVAVPGIAEALPLQESRPGHYVGRYTVRLQDRVQPGPVVATLRRGELTSSAQLAAPLAGARGTAALGAAPMTTGPLALQVLSPAGGTQVDSSHVVVQGRTLPHATVHAQVHAVPNTSAGQAAIALPVTEQTVQADASGNFSFSLGAQPVPPGARLEIDLAATQGNRTTPVQRHVLYQSAGMAQPAAALAPTNATP